MYSACFSVADEPIYEDIEDLELLLEEAGSDGETDNRSSAQPLCNAISKVRDTYYHRDETLSACTSIFGR